MANDETKKNTAKAGGRSLSAYIGLMLIVPLVAVTLLGAQLVRQSESGARSARTIESIIDVQAAAINALAPLQLERTALIGLARIDGYGIDRRLALGFIGFDFEALISENATELDARLETLESQLADERSLSAFGEALAAQRLDLEQVRELVSAGGASVATTSATMDELVGTVSGVIESSSLILADHIVDADAARLIEDARIAAALSTTASDETAIAADAVVSGGSVSADDVVATRLAHEEALSRAATVTEWDVSDLSELHASLAPTPVEFTDEGTLVNPAMIAQLGGLILERLDYVRAVGESSLAIEREVTTRAGTFADDAVRTKNLALLGVAAALLVALLGGFIVIRSVSRPLARLRNQAEQISRGHLHLDAIPTRGPVDVRRVTVAMNQMADTLAQLDSHMRSIGTGLGVDSVSLERLPGEVGATMRDSARQVTELTSRLQASEALLTQLVRRDHLTGLANRFAVHEHLERALASNRPAFGVLFIDLDEFKLVNDSYGHAVGDRVLCHLAERVDDAVRQDEMTARLGGDEFLAVVHGRGGLDALRSLGERLIAEIERPIEIDDTTVFLSASVGISIVESGDDATRIIDRADAALFLAKRNGRRRVEVFDESLRDSIDNSTEIERALEGAIGRDELELHLQPVVDTETGQAFGAEALVRWNRPGVGLVTPGDFIPIAERSGLIVRLERWVLHEACKVATRWRQHDPSCDFRIAVNISGRHLVHGDLVSNIVEALDATGADPEMLDIELTESMLLDDLDLAYEVLVELRRRGIRVSIDDFGTGYASITYLHRLPVDTVKVDRSFVAAVADGGFDAAIFDAVVAFAQSLRLDVVAEGIETAEQLAHVVDRGVGRAQGYLFARPAPSSLVTGMMFAGPLGDPQLRTPDRVVTATRSSS